jgi:hypothetical protein
MRQLFGEYLRAVFRHVYLLVAGGIGAVLTVVSLVAPTFLRIVGVSLLVFGVVGAQFQAWREMRGQRDEARSNMDEAGRKASEREAALLAKLNLREKRKAIRESLGEFFVQGEEVRAWIERGGKSVGYVDSGEGFVGFFTRPRDQDHPDLRGSLERALEWEEQVASFLVQYLGASYTALFRSQVGTTERPAPKLGSDKHSERWAMVDRRLQVLATIIKEAGEDLIGS